MYLLYLKDEPPTQQGSNVRGKIYKNIIRDGKTIKYNVTISEILVYL